MGTVSRISGVIIPLVAGWLVTATSCNRDNFDADSGTFTDARDSHEYRWIRIGTQIWMQENLAWLPSVEPSLGGSDSLPYYYVYGYEGRKTVEATGTDGYAECGVFYNWPAATGGHPGTDIVPSRIRGACPEGWHLPSDGEWDILVSYLGGEYTAGRTMKSRRGWNRYEGNPGRGDNSSGFDGLPVGGRQTAGVFYDQGYNAFFWSATAYNEFSAWYRYLGYFHNGVYRYFSSRQSGFSVRCVKD